MADVAIGRNPHTDVGMPALADVASTIRQHAPGREVVVWTMSRVSGSIAMRACGLSHVMPLAAREAFGVRPFLARCEPSGGCPFGPHRER
jgi:hypothetical protein